MDSSRFVSLYQSLILYYPAAALKSERERMIERRIDTDGHDRKFKVWVDWYPGGESILVAITPEYMSYSLSPVLSSVQNK